MTCAVSKDLMNILACPICKSPVRQEGNYIRCESQECGLQFPIREGIPIMLVEEAGREGGRL